LARLALLTPYLPAPAFTGGRIRIAQLARGLAPLGKLHLFAQAGLREARAARHAPELALFDSVHVSRLWGPARPWVPWPERVQRGSPRSLSRALLHTGPFDLVVVEHSHAAGLADLVDAPLLLDEHNIESRYQAARLAAQARRAPSQIARLEAWEQALWRRADAVVCVSEEDAEHVARFRQRPVVIIPNGVDTGRLPYVPPSAREGKVVLFVGLMDHAPNVEAAQLLAREIMPRVWAAEPAARLVLCGANPAPSVSALSGPRVEVTGRVVEVAPFLERARVCAFPLMQGAGSSLKVLEALASGVPLVASAVAVRGFDLDSDQHYLHADDSEAAAAAILRVLTEPPDDTRAEHGRSFAERFRWQALAERYRNLAAGLLRR
jgi:glycosyltransferase involved in cell wall biosynthesis